MAYVTSGLVQYLNAQGQDNANNIWEASVGNNATLNNFALTNISGFNTTTSSLVSDGVDDYALLPNSTEYAGSSFTAEIYLSFQELNFWMPIICHNNYISGGNGWEIGLDSSNTFYLSTGSYTQYFSAGRTFAMNTYYHFAVTYVGGNFTVYVNGTSIGGVGQGISASGLSVIFAGARRAQQGATGITDARRQSVKLLRWYNRPLTSTEITQNYNDILNPTTTVTNALTSSISLTSSLNASLNVARTNDLNGGIVSSSNLITSLLIVKPLNSNMTSISAILGNITLAKQLNSAINLGTSTSASLNIIKSLTGNISFNIVTIGDMGSSKSLFGSIDSSDNVTGNLSVTKPLSSNVNTGNTTQGILSQAHKLTSNIISISNVTGNLDAINNALLIGNVSSTTSVSGNINKTINLGGNVDIRTSTQCSIAGIVVILTGNMTSGVQVNSSIDKIVNLLCNVSDMSSVSSAITVIQKTCLSGNINEASSVHGNLFVSKLLGGSISASSKTQAYMNLTEIIYAEIFMRMINKYDLEMKYIDEYDLNMVYSKSSEYNMKL